MKKVFNTNSKTVKFGDVVSNANLVERDLKNSGIKRIVGLEHIDPENLHIRRWSTPEDGTSFTRKFIPGQTLFCKRRAYQRKVAFAEFEGICSGDILTFEPKEPNTFLPELLPFICQTDAFFDYTLGTSAGSLSPRTSWKALKDFEFPLPPLEEQKRIAEILWTADEVVEKFCAVIEACFRTKRVLERDLLKFNINSFTCSPRSKFTVPPNWSVCRLGDVVEIIGGGTPSRNVKKYFSGDIPWATPTDITGLRSRFISDTKEHISSDGLKNSSARLLPPGTLLMTSRATLGYCAISEMPVSTNQGFASMVCGEKIDNVFLLYLMQSMRQKIECLANGSTFLEISKRDLKRIEIPLPPIQEQIKIAGKFDAIDKSIASAEANIHCLQATSKTFLNRLFNNSVATYV